jgi:hypothetical protein
MRADHEELVLRNPALGACIFWHFSRMYSDYSSGRAPELPFFFIAAAMIFHARTVDKTSRMNFDSGVLKAVSERPDIIAGLQGRMEDYAQATLWSLQAASNSGILRRETGEGFPLFRAMGIDLPKPIRLGERSVSEMFSSAKRLGAWFANEPIDSLRKHLMIEF